MGYQLYCMHPTPLSRYVNSLTHWGRVTHICVGKLTVIGSDNGLSPARRQAIILTNSVILLIGLLGTNFSEILIGIQTFSFTKMHLKMSSAKWSPFCLGLNVLKLKVAILAWFLPAVLTTTILVYFKVIREILGIPAPLNHRGICSLIAI